MRPSRRDVLRYLLTTPLALTLDYERLLWVPSPRIVVPSLRRVTWQEINEITLAAFRPHIMDQFFTPSPLLEYLKEEGASPIGGAPLQPGLLYTNDVVRRVE